MKKAIILLAMMGCFLSIRQVIAEPITLSSLLEEMVNRDSLARFPQTDYRQLQASSYNRESTHRDAPGWFADSDGIGFTRTEEINGREEWVVMEHDGPGCVTKLWTPFFYYGGIDDKEGPNIKFYLDGSDKPVIDANFIKLVTGRGFIPSPFSVETARAGDVYLPVPFAKSCKITMDNKPFYHIINYRAYPEGTEVETFSMARFEAAKPTMSQVAQELLSPAPVADCMLLQASGSITTEKPLSLSLPEGNQVMRELELTVDPAEVAAHPALLRATILVMTFDGDQTVWCPVGDFFGSGNQLNPFHTWNRSVTSQGVLTCRWVMPWRETARIELVNLSDTVANISVKAMTGPWTWDDQSMHFHADWRPDDVLQGHEFKDWNFIDIKGKGVLVGDQWTVLNRTHGWWGEGDEKIYVDDAWDAGFPTHFGTGTEDYYGWAGGVNPVKEDKFDHPFLANILVGSTEANNTRGFNICTRHRGLDAIPFTTRLCFDMEASPGTEQRNPWDLLGYSAVTWWYALPGATCNRPPQPEAALKAIMSLDTIDARSTALRAAQYKHVEGAIEGESLKITAHSEGVEAYPQMPAPELKPEQVLSGAEHLLIPFTEPGQFIEFRLTEQFAPKRLNLHLTQSHDFGVVSISVNGITAEEHVDLFRPSLGITEVRLGVHEPLENGFAVRIELVQSNPRAQGAKTHAAVDYLLVKDS